MIIVRVGPFPLNYREDEEGELHRALYEAVFSIQGQEPYISISRTRSGDKTEVEVKGLFSSAGSVEQALAECQLLARSMTEKISPLVPNLNISFIVPLSILEGWSSRG